LEGFINKPQEHFTTKRTKNTKGTQILSKAFLLFVFFVFFVVIIVSGLKSAPHFWKAHHAIAYRT
jgi:hypothetical protein